MYNAPTKGKERSLETKSKISSKLTGRKLTEEHKEKIKCNPKNNCNYKNFTLSEKKQRSAQISNGLILHYKNNPEAREKLIEHLKNRIIKEETRKKLRENMQKRIANGTHKGWAKRNKPSYAEIFFMNVLKNNDIEYEFEKKVGKYFIDFALNNKNIALEIDGKQHNLPDRKLKDEEKDKFLSEQNWKVYRIQWKNIRNPDGSDYIKKEIEKFIEFYNSLN